MVSVPSKCRPKLATATHATSDGENPRTAERSSGGFAFLALCEQRLNQFYAISTRPKHSPYLQPPRADPSPRAAIAGVLLDRPLTSAIPGFRTKREHFLDRL